MYEFLHSQGQIRPFGDVGLNVRFAPKSGLGLPVNASASSVRLCRVNVCDRRYTVRWHPITVETAAAGMLRSRHEQHRELGDQF